MKKQHPFNVLLITTDQQRVDSLSCYGSSFTQTPHLDRLAEEGARFDRAYCANPVCTPARASIFSGQYLSKHGAWNVGMNVPQDLHLLSHHLGAAGYTTHYIGKAHFQAFGARPEQTYEAIHDWETHYPAFHGPYYGFERVELALGHTLYGIAGHYGAWVRSHISESEVNAFKSARRLGEHNFEGNAWDWHLPTALHNSTWTAERAVDFLKNHDPDQPFFLSLGFQDPHHPHCLPMDFTRRVDPALVPLPRYTEGELDDKPPHFNLARQGKLEGSLYRGEYPVAGQGGGANFELVEEAEARLGRAYYYSMVRLIDQQMGRVLNCLDEQGLSANTLVIFTTDHGELLGDHGLWMKGPFHYEELVRIPLLMRLPGVIPSGIHIQGLASQVDLAPTVLAILGKHLPSLSPLPEADGVDLLPVLTGTKPTVQEAVIVECVDDPHGLRLKTVITAGEKMTVYHNQPFGEYYDLKADPGELLNRWSDPAYAPQRQRLFHLLLDHAERLEKRVPRICYA